MYKKNFIPLLFFTLMAFADAFATFPNSIIEPPKKIPVTVGNWDHEMDDNGCVLLKEGNILTIQIKVTLTDYNLSAYDDLYIRAEFKNLSTTVIGPIQQADLVPEYTEEGCYVYVYTEEIFNGNFYEECRENPITPITFQYQIELIDSLGNPYPLIDNVGLVNGCRTEGVSDEISPELIYSGTKMLCCYPEPENRSAKPKTISEATIKPNPFQEILNINFEAEGMSSTTIQLWNINGQKMLEIEVSSVDHGIQETAIATHDLASGVYFCKIINKTRSQVVEVVKM